MFYFNNNTEDMQKVLKQIFTSPTEDVMKKIIAWYAVDGKDEAAVVQECFIFFKINQTVPLDWKAFEEELKASERGIKNTSINLSAVMDKYPLYQIRIKATSRQKLMSFIADKIIKGNFLNNSNVYDVSVIARVTPKRETYLANAKDSINYIESRIYHLMKMLYLHPDRMMKGEICLDMNKSESYDKLDSIVMFCLTYKPDIKINLNYTTITERVEICKTLHERLAHGGFYVPYQTIQNMLVNLTTNVCMETDGTVVYI